MRSPPGMPNRASNFSAPRRLKLTTRRSFRGGGPFQVVEARQQGGAERSGEVIAPHAPVEAGFAATAVARCRWSRGRCRNLQRSVGLFGVSASRASSNEIGLASCQVVEHLYAAVAGEMIVADRA